MRLYDLIQQSETLKFLDPNSGKYAKVSDFNSSIKMDNYHGLVYIYSNNTIATVEVFLNFLQSDFTVCLLSEHLNFEFKQRLEQTYEPYYIYDPTRKEIEGYEMEFVATSITLFRRKIKPTSCIHKDIKLLLSTSGTTGSPKFVKLSETNLVQNALSILDYMPINKDQVVPLNVPIAFVYGLSVFTTNCIKGTTIVCTDKDILQKDFWKDFDTYKFSTLSGVPYVYEMLYRIGFFKKKHDSLEYMTQAGGKLSETLVKVISAYSKKYNIPFYTQYGQTEATGRMAFLDPKDLLKNGYSIGKPILGGKFEINEDTKELIYFGENVFGGYANKKEDLKTFLKTTKLLTGDLAKMDAQGCYHIIGRMKRIIKLFGTRLNLDEVEQILKTNIEGETFVCVGIEDTYLAIVYLNPNLSKKLIVKTLRDKLKIHPTSLQIKYLEQIPKNLNGKVDYHELKSAILLGDNID